MKAKTEELLYLLLWAGETLLRPTFRNMTGSYEEWAYRSGLMRQLSVLEKRQLLESQHEQGMERVYRLTEAGRTIALGGRDPVAHWKRAWDGKWRMVLYDVPQAKANLRASLQRSLAERGFGNLQNSVWITPDPLTGERERLLKDPVDVGALFLIEGRACAGESDQEIVSRAWNFDAINAAYDRHAEVLARRPKQATVLDGSAKSFHRWLEEERLVWNEALALDPLLPECLHPANYAGVKAWKRRLEAQNKAGQQIRAFRTAT